MKIDITPTQIAARVDGTIIAVKWGKDWHAWASKEGDKTCECYRCFEMRRQLKDTEDAETGDKL